MKFVWIAVVLVALFALVIGINALRAGDTTSTGQRLAHSAGLAQCLDALRPHWKKAHDEIAAFNAHSGHRRRGVGIGCMWYGIGNTSMSNPSHMRVGLSPAGTLTLYSGAVDIGQGSNTIMTQIAADALGLPAAQFALVAGDTDLTADAGKTSASRQTFVSGMAAERAGRDLRRQILRLANAGPGAELSLEGAKLTVRDGGEVRRIDLASAGMLMGEGTFDPPTTPLDADGQGVPYATYAFAAQMATVEVDTELGTVKVLRLVAAHDWAPPRLERKRSDKENEQCGDRDQYGDQTDGNAEARHLGVDQHHRAYGEGDDSARA